MKKSSIRVIQNVPVLKSTTIWTFMSACACGMSGWEEANNCFRLSAICCARVSYWNLSTHCKFKSNDPSVCGQYWIMMWLCVPMLNCIGKKAKNSEALPFGTNNSLFASFWISIDVSFCSACVSAFHCGELQRLWLGGWLLRSCPLQF